VRTLLFAHSKFVLLLLHRQCRVLDFSVRHVQEWCLQHRQHGHHRQQVGDLQPILLFLLGNSDTHGSMRVVHWDRAGGIAVHGDEATDYESVHTTGDLCLVEKFCLGYLLDELRYRRADSYGDVRFDCWRNDRRRFSLRRTG
jgi:hypothetical protein